MSGITSKMPRQKLPYKQKGKAWRVSNVDAADKYSFYNNERVRQTVQNRVINLNLYNGIVSSEDMIQTLNPQQIDAEFITKKIPHKPIMVPKIDVLVGEEINRPFDWFFTVVNKDAISKKEEEKSKLVKEKLISILQQGLSEEEAQQELEKHNKYLKYNFQDSRERMVNHLLKHYYEELGFENKLNAGLKDVFIMAEEIYQCDIVSGEPTFEKLNPIKVHSVRSGNSSKIEDSDLIVIEDHWSPGKIIDVFYDELKSADIDTITEYSTSTGSSKYTTDDENHLLLRDQHSEVLNDYIGIAEINGHQFSSSFIDSAGNVRILRVYWRSQKKIFKLKFYDEYGEVDYKYVSEEYIPNEDLGEEVTTYWVNEWWEGTKIGKDIYIRMRPKPVQYNRLSNPSVCGPGIVGEVYNTTQGRAVSMVDKMKNYQYLYDVIWDRLNTAIAKNLGKILLLDISLIPAGWEPEKWIAQATKLGIGVIDGFKEGNAGAAQGKLAGQMNGTNTRAIDLETGNYIQQHIQLLEFIKTEMGEIAGISKQREGNISNRETVGGVERGVTQSSHITEWWFMKHEEVKRRCLSVFLETAKIALKDNTKKLQFITDDMSMQIIDIDGNEINEADYGLVVSSSANIKKVHQTLETLAQAFLQNGGSYTTVIDILTSQSLADIRRKIEDSEEQTNARNAKIEEDRNAVAQQQIQSQSETAQLDRELKVYEIDKRSDTEIQKAIIHSNDKQLALENTETEDNEPTDFDYQKHKDELMLKIKALDNQMKMHTDKMEKEDKKIAVSKQKKATS
jgi:hypothetical protein